MSKKNETIVPPTPNPITPGEPPAPTPDPAPETVSKADFDKLLQQTNQLRQEAEDAKKAIKERELKDLQTNQEWQKVAEVKAKEADDAKAEMEATKKAFQTQKKLIAVREAAMQSGIIKEAMEELNRASIDSPELKLETTSDGDVRVLGVDKLLTRLKTTKPHWFKPSVPNVNPSSPGVTSTPSAQSDLSELRAKIKAAATEAQKSGKYEKYNELVMQYKKQSRA